MWKSYPGIVSQEMAVDRDDLDMRHPDTVFETSIADMDSVDSSTVDSDMDADHGVVDMHAYADDHAIADMNVGDHMHAVVMVLAVYSKYFDVDVKCFDVHTMYIRAAVDVGADRADAIPVYVLHDGAVDVIHAA
jgi:hypothetical protein